MVSLSDGVDYFFNLTELSLLQRASSQCFPVPIIPDDRLESLEVFGLTLSTTDSEVLTTELSSTTISILNDDSKNSPLSLFLSLSLSLSLSPSLLHCIVSISLYYPAAVMVSLQDVAYSGSEGSSINACVIAGPSDRAFVVTLSTIQDTASAG